MAKTKKKETGPKVLTRKVFFYRVNAGVEQDTGQPRKVNFGPALKHLNDMPFTLDGRYLATEDGKQLCCWVDNLPLPHRLRLANIRRDQHPPVESDGAFSPLILGKGRGLAEITHLVLFPDGICGAEFNFYGPRASALSFYFALKLNGICPGFKLNPLIRNDLNARLAALTDIKFLNIKVRASYASVVEEADKDLGAAFKATIGAVAARPQDELELMFVRKKNKKFVDRAVPSSLIGAIRKLANRSDLREQVSIFKVTGMLGAASSPLDILSEQFTAERTVEPAADMLGGVDSASMFAVIEHAYAEVQAQLSVASEIE